MAVGTVDQGALMADHTLKFPLVEKVAGWKIGLLSAYMSLHEQELSPGEMRAKLFQRLFELRRDLWTRDVPYLLREAQKADNERFLLAQQSAVR